MDGTFGRLIVAQGGGPEREFELGKAVVTLGRGLTSDVVLADTRASRLHAQIECSDSGCQIVDLGSSNGTRLNGVAVQRAALRPGDTLTLGSSRLRYESSRPQPGALEETRIDSAADVALSMEHAVLPVSLRQLTTPHLIVFFGEETWEVPLDGSERVTVGRSAENEVVIEHPSVSRHHAEVVRRHDSWLLRDLGSSNGTWFRGHRVEELALHEGDTFRAGQAQIVFKAGQDALELTMADETLARIPTRRPIVFVPGMMGSELWLGNERVWPSVKTLLTNPEMYRLPSPVPLETRGIVDELVIVPNLIKQDQYNRLGDYLVEELGYRRGVDFFEFAYDWRQDVRASAQKLAQFVDELPTPLSVTMVAHSLGTQISRYYIERLGGKARVERAMLMGGPHMGSIKALTTVLLGPKVLPLGLLGERLRQVVLTFPATYQVLPTYACGVDQNGARINFLDYEGWLGEDYRPFLRATRDFRRELGSRASVPTISIFGYSINTITGVTVRRTAAGDVADVTYETEPRGDSSVLESSAVLPGTEIHPVQQYHGSLFVDNDVKMRLKLELARQLG